MTAWTCTAATARTFAQDQTSGRKTHKQATGKGQGKYRPWRRARLQAVLEKLFPGVNLSNGGDCQCLNGLVLFSPFY